MKAALLAFFMVACLLSVAAQASDAIPAPAKEIPAAKPATTTEQRDHRRPVCVVTGKVTGMQAIEKTPWADETPSTLTVTEVHMALKVDKRRPQRNTTAASDCSLPDNGTGLYKLCSPTQVKLGDTIMGTEGLATGSESALGCLFDVVVIPSAEAPR